MVQSFAKKRAPLFLTLNYFIFTFDCCQDSVAKVKMESHCQDSFRFHKDAWRMMPLVDSVNISVDFHCRCSVLLLCSVVVLGQCNRQ